MPSASIEVVSCCDYLTTLGDWRPIDFKAGQMVKAIKGKPFKGFFETKIKGVHYRFSQENIGQFVTLVPEHMANILRAHFPETVTLVPIPNSHCTSATQGDFHTLRLATEIADHAKAKLCAALVFKEPQTPSHKGGTRNATFIEKALKLVDVPSSPVVLVDDVYTSGSHMRAACWKLNTVGVDVIGAITFGRSTKVQRDKPTTPFVQSLGIDRTSAAADFDV